MIITWQGTDITEYVTVRKAVARDTCGGRCDGLEMEFENAESWYRWGPEEDNTIRVTEGQWDSGTLYLNTIAPGDGKYRILATALPCSARKKEWRSYENKSIEEILRACAAMTGMEWQTFGIDEKLIIPYIQQENEGCAAFLHRLATLEGAKLKCVGGKYTMIGLDWAQDRDAATEITVKADQDGVDYRKSGSKDKGLLLVTPYARGEARDSAVADDHARQETNAYPALNNIQAARWARNLLKEKNRKCERVKIASTFNAAWSAMYRADISGGTDADGHWMMEEAEHDLINKTSNATLYRCIYSIT